jgi:aminopeptidase N
MDAALSALPAERTEQNVQLVTGYVSDLFWRFLTDEERNVYAPRLERTMRAGLTRARTASLKSTYFTAFYRTATTPAGVAWLEEVWRRHVSIPGLRLAEPDEATLALELAVRGVPAAEAILQEQRSRFTNPDRKARFEFVMPALAENPVTRDAFFASLAELANRRREPWAAEGLRYMNHPLRAAHARRHLPRALEMLAEIQRTGDIFFPSDWMNATLWGHNSGEAATAVRRFLDRAPAYPERLRRIVLQAAHNLFRAVEIVGGQAAHR